MRLKAFSPTADCSHHHASFQAFAPSVPSSFFTSSSSSSPSSSFRLRNPEMDSSPVSLVVLSNPFASRTLLKSRSFNKISRGGAIRRSCSLNLDGILREEPSFHVEGSAIKMSNTRKEEEGRRKTRKTRKKRHCAISNSSSPFLGGRQQGKDMQDSFLNSSFDFLEPMMLGIKPEELPDRETAAWAIIERKANSFDIPISLRMIKKKLQWEEGFAGAKEELDSDSEEGYCSVKAAFASMVFIIVELQSCALHMREALCHEDLEIITSKVQKEMHYSFVWLFKHVFSRTPALMLHVMILLANFSVHSASYNSAKGGENALFMENALSAEQSRANSAQQNQQMNSLLSVEEKTTEAGNLQESVEHPIIYPSDEFASVEEMNLWNSMVDDAAKMREGNEDGALDHDTMQHLVSPVSVELESDRYRDYLRTDLLYQMNLSQEPDNPLLLCNYAQFLHLVAHDYHRSEECFKRAVQVTPPDAESLSQYAHFLWTVRKDYWAAEESFLQALALEPGNPYYASRYANFLWSTGGEETCFPLNNSHNPNV